MIEVQKKKLLIFNSKTKQEFAYKLIYVLANGRYQKLMEDSCIEIHHTNEIIDQKPKMFHKN